MDGDTVEAAAAAPAPAAPSLQDKRAALAACIRADIYAADLRWSLFVAAAQSFKYDTVLRPFPPQFGRGDVKEIDRLREVMTQMPAFPTLLSLLENPATDCSDRGELIDLLYWVLIVQDDPGIRTLSKEEIDEVIAQAPGGKLPRPHFIFAVNQKKVTEKNKRFTELSKSFKTFLGYHGSRIDNFFSILCHGLISTLSKREVYGKGTYLSTDFSTSLNFSPSGCGWGASLIGSGLSCMALCEVLEHPDVIYEKSDADTKKTAEDSQFGPVPQKYILVRNSDLVQIRYLLVDGKNPHSLTCHKEANDSMIGWFCKHKMFTLMLGYVLLLSAVGMSNSPTVMRYCRMFLRRWNH
ncbi:Protein mono-ADP-ribosyltransferase PARP16 [Frankliniella fusca]|uniref:Poly [ADP-ribose] polymerase n=1 Tax=Frankliniella fusca TaxID=407009 RepID=A0AAE1HM89_9NEOP|nr:Protein mono-ADP-ribosyltransferase PARP16 [Frankliniella fusca]